MGFHHSCIGKIIPVCFKHKLYPKFVFLSKNTTPLPQKMLYPMRKFLTLIALSSATPLVTATTPTGGSLLQYENGESWREEGDEVDENGNTISQSQKEDQANEKVEQEWN